MITDYTELIKELEIQAEKHKSVLLAVAADAIEQLVDDNKQLKKNKPQTGKWSDEMVGYNDEFGDFHFGFQCSVCGAIINKTNYCGKCGARMEE